MKRVLRVILCLLFAAGLSSGKDFMGIPIEESEAIAERPLPTWIFGGGGFLRYYLTSVDGGVRASADFRFLKHHSLGLFGMLHLGDDLSEVGIDYRFYFLGRLMQSGHDDFLRLGFSGLYMEKGDETFFPPVISFGYGRDILFFKKADLLGRIQLSGNYIIGEPVSKRQEWLLMDQEAHFLLSLEFSLMFF